ncbi:fumarylacetoacetate hydrolase family protein [Colwellia sp. D2M02]|uniref:fumarylacetoacetate hydrolase family protein n=1 Tax=Colwellia sp. D2M02 TaxID=2841562 RepID=UPI001C099F60|nr:fumarylacetoacetate hydrolase family protein [Colwellia sp. D2M02]MBU2894325.1 fumarylacetoacetate hydrolase family protein [Colwellia sp. D2M02]
MKTINLLTTNAQLAITTSTLTPSKILCIGRNYVEHIKELNNDVPDEMVVFFKPNSAISSVLNAHHLMEPLHYEAELCFLYQQGKFSAVALGLDLTKRTLQSALKAKGLPWERAKAFDGSAVFSDFVAIESHHIDHLSLSLTINNTLTQQGSVELMMYKPVEILAELLQFVSLEDGDIVMTGTPKGVGVIQSGDSFSGSVSINSSAANVTEAEVLINQQWFAQ